jgi:hypothetical protein
MELLEFMFIEHFEECDGEPTTEKLDALFLRSPQRLEKTMKKFYFNKAALKRVKDQRLVSDFPIIESDGESTCSENLSECDDSLCLPSVPNFSPKQKSSKLFLGMQEYCSNADFFSGDASSVPDY